MSNISNRDHLIIGATGMLAPLCRSISADRLIVSARFISNQQQVAKLSADVMQIPLDYTDKQSQLEFLSQLSEWQQLKYCILWIHSYAHEFSFQMIETLAKFDNGVKIIHLFGSTADDSRLVDYAIKCARKYAVDFYPVRLGTKQTMTGQRWLTHKEISEEVSEVLGKLYQTEKTKP